MAEEPAAEEASTEDNKAVEEVAAVEEPKPDAAKEPASSLPAGALHSHRSVVFARSQEYEESPSNQRRACSGRPGQLS